MKKQKRLYAILSMLPYSNKEYLKLSNHLIRSHLEMFLAKRDFRVLGNQCVYRHYDITDCMPAALRLKSMHFEV